MRAVLFGWTLVIATMLAGVVVSVATTSTPLLLWQDSVEVAAGRGEKGPWRQNDSRYDYVDDPTVAIDDRGEAAVAWVDQARKAVLFQRYTADGAPLLDAPVDVSRHSATFSWLPRLALAPGDPDKVFVLWQEIIFSGGSHGGDMLFARSQDGGATFAEPINLSNSIGGDGKGRINRDVWHNGSYDLLVENDAILYAVWTEYDGPLWFSRSIDGGNSFSLPTRVAASNAQPARGPSLALGRDGTLYVAWTVGEDDAADLRLATSADDGATFTDPRVIAPSASYSDAPKLAVAPDGALHLVYAESAGGPFDRYHIRYTRSTDGGRTFARARAISDVNPRSAPGAAFPALSIDAKGSIYVLWELLPNPRRHPRGLGFAVSRDGGERFSVPIVVPGSRDPAGGTNGSHQGLLMEKLSVNRAGEIAIVNSSLKQGEQSRVWLIRARTDYE